MDVLYDAVKRAGQAAGLSFALFNKNEGLILVVSLPTGDGRTARCRRGWSIG